MKRLPEKIKSLIALRDVAQADVARSIDVDTSQFSKWLKGRGSPSVEQLLGMARYLKVPMEYLADDGMDDVPAEPSKETKAAGPSFNEEECRLIWLVQNLGITTNEAVRRLSGEPASTASGQSRPMNTRDESEAARRNKEEKRRLGFKDVPSINMGDHEK